MFLGIVAILTGIAYCMNSVVELYTMLISFLIAKQRYKYKFHCKSFNFDEIDEEIVIQRLIYHLKGKDLYDKIGYSKPQMIRREQRIESILKIPLKRYTK
jgi:hypothetical protein